MLDAVTFYNQFSGTDRTPDNYGYNPTDTPHNLSIGVHDHIAAGQVHAERRLPRT